MPRPLRCACSAREGELPEGAEKVKEASEREVEQLIVFAFTNTKKVVSFCALVAGIQASARVFFDSGTKRHVEGSAGACWRAEAR